jgi:hypothetical protein
LKKIETYIDIIDLKVSVNKINNIKNNGLIIECNSKKECESLKENILINAKLSEECSSLILRSDKSENKFKKITIIRLL